ncbi:MAG: hypothetical protein ACXVBE_04360, partial [Bdellovibrionota bacterium]
MKREFQGKQFESVHVSTLKSGQELPYDLYVFLPLNVRMVKIRARGQALDSAAISSYTSRGH